MATFKDFCVSNNINLSRDKDGKLNYFDHKVTDKEGKEQTYRIFNGTNPDGKKLLFIPSLNAFADAQNGKTPLAQTEVVNDGVCTNDGTPILFLHRQATASGSIDAGF